MVAVNEEGETSMPSVGIKVVTHVEGEKNSISGDTSPLPQLPDTVACCEAANVTDRGCIDLICDPLSLPAVEMGDMVKCAPFDREMFTCLGDTCEHRLLVLSQRRRKPLS